VVRVATSSLLEARLVTEPLLAFANGGLHVDPKEGLARFGPRSWSPKRRHPDVVRVGFVGSANSVERAMQWLRVAGEGVRGEGPHLSFPGCAEDRGYYTRLDIADDRTQVLSQRELRLLKDLESDRARFEATLALLEEKLSLLADLDQAPDYVVMAIPDQLFKASRAVEYFDADGGRVHRDLRRALKARAMRYRIPTQVVLGDTTTLKPRPGQDHPAEIAWDFFTGLYFKAGGVPWSPTGLPANTCYIGVSFYRPLGSSGSKIQTSLVQAFDENGEGLILRGHEFEWDSAREGTRAPHLPEETAAELVNMALDRYERELRVRPRRVVVHKTSRHWPAETKGFQAALDARVDLHDLVALRASDDVVLFPESKYPPLRGTQFRVGDLDYLYTTGFVADLGEFHGRHVPSPLQLADHLGHDTARDDLLKEILVLTKLNWNSARLGGLLPITLRFSQRVGDILKELPPTVDPLPQAKYYM